MSSEIKNGDQVAASRRNFLIGTPRRILDGIRSIATWGDAEPNGTNGKSLGALVARIDISKCHAWGGASCQLCYLACPLREEAIEMKDQKPVVNASKCDGCAMCIPACETVNDQSAIRMVSLESDGIADKRRKEVSK